MPPKPQPPRQPSSAPPDSLPPTSDALPGDLRREDQSAVPPDSLPDADEEADGDDTVGAHSLAPDGGVAEHPIHDDDPSEDFTPNDYEEQIDEVADASRDRRKRADVEER
jgi:hypothetical protein